MFIPEVRRSLDDLIKAKKEVWVTNTTARLLLTGGRHGHIPPGATKVNLTLAYGNNLEDMADVGAYIRSGSLILFNPDFITAEERKTNQPELPATIDAAAKDLDGNRVTKRGAARRAYLETLLTQPELTANDVLDVVEQSMLSDPSDVEYLCTYHNVDLRRQVMATILSDLGKYVVEDLQGTAQAFMESFQSWAGHVRSDWDSELRSAFMTGKLSEAQLTLEPDAARRVLQGKPAKKRQPRQPRQA